MKKIKIENIETKLKECVNEKMTHKKICETLSISQSTLNRLLRKYGLTQKKPKIKVISQENNYSLFFHLDLFKSGVEKQKSLLENQKEKAITELNKLIEVINNL